jgi:hypothetical protein
MHKRARIILAIRCGELYKNIAADEGCTAAYIAKVAVKNGLRRNSTRANLVQVNSYHSHADITALKSLGKISTQIRIAVREYVERKQDAERVNRTSVDSETPDRESLSGH